MESAGLAVGAFFVRTLAHMHLVYIAHELAEASTHLRQHNHGKA